VKELYGSRLELYHIIELVDMAGGGRPLHRTRRRAFQIIAIISANVLRMLFQGDARQRFYVDISRFEHALQSDDIDLQPGRLVNFFNTVYGSPAIQNPVVLSMLHFTVRLVINVRRRLSHE